MASSSSTRTLIKDRTRLHGRNHFDEKRKAKALLSSMHVIVNKNISKEYKAYKCRACSILYYSICPSFCVAGYNQTFFLRWNLSLPYLTGFCTKEHHQSALLLLKSCQKILSSILFRNLMQILKFELALRYA